MSGVPAPFQVSTTTGVLRGPEATAVVEKNCKRSIDG
jgi:hypothetical protein